MIRARSIDRPCRSAVLAIGPGFGAHDRGPDVDLAFKFWVDPDRDVDIRAVHVAAVCFGLVVEARRF